MKLYLLEETHFNQRAKDSREIIEYARTLTEKERAEEKKGIIEGLKASGSIFLTPTSDDELKLSVIDGRAQIFIHGELTPKAEKDICGAYTAQALTEYGYIKESIKAAEANKDVESIDFIINSPGGAVSGIEDAAQAIANTPLPTRGIIHDMAASGAYWLASQMDTLEAMSPLSRVGSIGVITEDFNLDRGYAENGIDHHVITSSNAPNKYQDTNTEKGRKGIIKQLDDIESIFIDRVSSGRGVSTKHVKEKFGQGGLLIASDAKSVGMIDVIHGEKLERNNKKNIIVDDKAGDPASKEEGEKEVKTLEEFKAESPILFDEVLAMGRKEGIEAERKRQSDLSKWIDVNSECAKIANEAIASGKTYSDVDSALHAAAAKGNVAKEEKEDDNAANVASGTSVEHAALDAEDKKAAELFGMSAAEYKKYSKIAEEGNFSDGGAE